MDHMLTRSQLTRAEEHFQPSGSRSQPQLADAQRQRRGTAVSRWRLRVWPGVPCCPLQSWRQTPFPNAVDPSRGGATYFSAEMAVYSSEYFRRDVSI
jgi:hypothetical protein